MQHRSPGLTAIYNEIKASKHNRILDLGSINAANFNFLAQLSCKVHFENLNDFIVSNKATDEAQFINELTSFILSHPPEEKFDVILTWDLLNYLPLAGIKALFEKLNVYCHPNTLLHSMRYLGKNIPQMPARMEIIDQYTLRINVPALQPRQYACHPTAALIKSLPDYFMHNHLADEDGMQRGLSEQVLRYQPEASGRREFIANTELNTKAESPPQPASVAQGNPLANTYYAPSVDRLLSIDTQHQCILDLGAKSSRNMNLWRARFAEVHTEDLSASLRWRNNQHFSVEQENNGISEQALRFNHSQIFDLVIFWDTLNYCTKHQLLAIGEKLRWHCRHGAQILIFSYLGETIPEYPLRFEMYSDNRYRVQESRQIARRVPPLTTSGIMKMVPEWRLIHTELFTKGMRRGMVEFIFEHIADNSKSANLR